MRLWLCTNHVTNSKCVCWNKIDSFLNSLCNSYQTSWRIFFFASQIDVQKIIRTKKNSIIRSDTVGVNSAWRGWISLRNFVFLMALHTMKIVKHLCFRPGFSALCKQLSSPEFRWKLSECWNFAKMWNNYLHLMNFFDEVI